MSKGKIKEYDPHHGCGIVVDIDTGQELTVYANYTNLKDREVLTAGRDVEYEIKNNRHDNWAVNVRVL